jgi:hypothetical protein
VSDFPRSLIEFQQRFSQEEACAKYLFAARWPQGFVCPGCGTSTAWELQTKPWTWECAGCGRQTSVTAGTIRHHSKLPLTTWFWAAYRMATHSNGISALQLQRQLGLGSYRSAWLLCGKLRASMVAPGRTALAGLVEVDETEIPCRSKNDPVTGGGGRSHQGKMLIVGAVEVQDGGAGPGRIRLNQVSDYSTDSLHPFIAGNLAPDNPKGRWRRKIRARTVAIASSHVVMLSSPSEVADVIIQAASSPVTLQGDSHGRPAHQRKDPRGRPMTCPCFGCCATCSG